MIVTLWYSVMLLGLEAGNVIGLRTMRIASGGDAGFKEMQLMVSEKMDAGFEASTSLMRGGDLPSVVARYRDHVASNARRLSHE